MKLSSTGTAAFFTPHLLPSRMKNLGIIELNNPGALNALNLDMVRSINSALAAWDANDSVKATLFVGRESTNKKGETRPVFCAGGDVKSVYESGMKKVCDEEGKQPYHGYGKSNLLTSDFFREEYIMNHRIATQKSSCPQISIWDGVVMGGGVGISVHGKYRIATENTLFAMPETGIGLFPDVGGMYFLPRLKGGLGPYIALTGAKLKANDLIYAGIATHYIPSSKIEDLTSSLADATVGSSQDADVVGDVLASFREVTDTYNSHLVKNRENIDFAFEGKESAEDIVTALKDLASRDNEKCKDFGTQTLSTLLKMSPTSVKVTLEGLKRGASVKDITEDLKMEYRMSQGFMREGSDFYEGIRAVLVDKDRNPKWNPNTLDGVSNDHVESYFENLGENELNFEKSPSPKL
eukprot:CAMPEP_0195522462 /NCGR_PEP_ID=MMETSP0794_2-20130614/20663_1 /TAXON_ID=515487 /ORGANISM="Stephanopyxis turris, Strain CCMP 815" /LENGTH=408 /DNA_ID=CAMNT_0040652225 /DNA_START=75 /DNA_END=1301 /DNA_ORIENTATION=+